MAAALDLLAMVTPVSVCFGSSTKYTTLRGCITCYANRRAAYMQHPKHGRQHSSHGAAAAAAVLKLTVAPTGIVMLRTLTVLLNWAQPCRTTGVPVGMVMSVAAVAVLNKDSQRTIVLVSCMRGTSVRITFSMVGCSIS